MSAPHVTGHTIRVVLFDLDGVIRHFDPAHVISVEQRHGLASGTLQSVAFEPSLGHPVITGQMTRAEWVRQVGERVGSPDAAAEWLGARGAVDLEMMGIVDGLRAGGVPVAVLTNGTDTIPDELRELGIDGRFDRVFNSAAIGSAKPDPAVFLHVCEQLDVAPAAVFFTDDTERNLSGAIELGMDAHLFTAVAALRTQLTARGLIAA